jgi:hypothetical protein
MKRLFRIFELSKSEQRVVLIVVLILIAVAFVQYEFRVNRSPIQPTSLAEAKASPSPVQIDVEQ